MDKGLSQEVRAALRTIAAAPAIAVPAIVTLALALGANAAVFSVFNALLLRPLPVTEPERLATITSDFAISRGFRAGAGWSAPMWEALRDRAHLFGGVLAWHPGQFTVETRDGSDRLRGYFVSGGFFTTLGIKPGLGRFFTSDDDRPNDPRSLVAVLSHEAWQRYLGGTEDVLGTTLVVDGVPVTIVGATPASFRGLEVGQPFEIAFPLGAEPSIRGWGAGLFRPRRFLFQVMLRMKEGQTIESATRVLRTIQPEILQGNEPAFVREPFSLSSAMHGTSGPSSPQQLYRRPLLLLLAGVGIVLVVGCLNLANLLLARAVARQKDLAVRHALGASRWRLARPLIIESIVIAVAGAALGLLLAGWGARAIVFASPVHLQPVLDWRVIAFTGLIAFTSIVLFGVMPAWLTARRSRYELLRIGSGTIPGARGGVAEGLLIGQIALCMIVLVGSGLLVQTFVRLRSTPLGFDADRILVTEVEMPRETLANPPELSRRLIEVIRSQPGVAMAAASMWTPLSGGGTIRGVVPPAASPERDEVAVLANFVSPGWFDTYGIPLKAGRDFNSHDTARTPAVVIVNETFARRFMGNRMPPGARLGDGKEVIGVVGDSVYRSAQRIPGVTSLAVREPIAPTVYAPLAQASGWDLPTEGSARISIRTDQEEPGSLARGIAAAIRRVDPRQTFHVRPLSRDVDASLGQERMSAAVAASFALLSFLLALVGLYGVVTFRTSRRVREFAVRAALGAPPPQIRRSILIRVSFILGIGILIGLAGAAVVTRTLSTMLYGVTPLDPVTIAAGSLLLAAGGVAAGIGPARRAAGTDPTVLLRLE